MSERVFRSGALAQHAQPEPAAGVELPDFRAWLSDYLAGLLWSPHSTERTINEIAEKVAATLAAKAAELERLRAERDEARERLAAVEGALREVPDPGDRGYCPNCGRLELEHYSSRGMNYSRLKHKPTCWYGRIQMLLADAALASPQPRTQEPRTITGDGEPLPNRRDPRELEETVMDGRLGPVPKEQSDAE
jgi:hypothetical protein